MFRLLIPLFLFLITSSGCGLAYRTILGIDSKPEWLLDEEIIRKFDKRKIPEANRYVLDTASYYNSLKADFYAEVEQAKASVSPLDSIYFKKLQSIAKDDGQSVQIRYFDKEGNAIFKLVNCYIEPPIPMNWNVEGSFDVFPPHNDIENLNYRNRELTYFLPLISNLDGDRITVDDMPSADYYAIVFWNDYMIKPSKKLIKLLKNYDNNHPDQTTFYLFVNNHNAYLWQLMDANQRAEVMEYIEENRISEIKR